MKDTHKIINWALILTPAILLAITIIGSSLSGNDKAPYVIFILSGMYAIIFVLSGIIYLFKRQSTAGFLCLGAFISLLYVAIAIFLGRAGIVDTISFLGFR